MADETDYRMQLVCLRVWRQASYDIMKQLGDVRIPEPADLLV